ncbi:MAG: outer membrane beta-barrel protein [Bacteroides sp.]|nr:outer membrane beta-barrel protein [Bacteroides sp.]
MKEELWLKKMKERLDDYSEPVPSSGWEQLEQELSALEPKPSEDESSSFVAPTGGKKKLIPFRRWTMVTAAALLVAVSGVSIWLLQSRLAEDVRHTRVPSLAAVPDVQPKQAPEDVQMEASEPVIYQGTGKRHPAGKHDLLAQHRNDDTSGNATDVQETKEIAKEGMTEATTVGKTEELAKSETVNKSEATETSEAPKEKRKRYRPSGKDKLHLPAETKKRTKAEKWSLGLAVGNAAGFAEDADEMAYMSDTSNDYHLASDGVDGVFSSSEEMPGEDSYQKVVYEDGMSYLVEQKQRMSSISHKQPISVGLSVRKGLQDGFSVETGLTYTYLASDVRYEGRSKQSSQKLHYLGIPVRLNWNFVDKKTLTMYLAGGGMVEKCIYGKIGNDTETVKPLQFSVMGAVGLQVNATKRIGIYLEPGVSYYFDDGSNVETIRKETPLNISFHAGIRLTY